MASPRKDGAGTPTARPHAKRQPCRGNLSPPLWLPLPERSRGDREEPHCSPGFVDRAYLFFLKLRTTLHQRDTDRFEAALTPFPLGPEGLPNVCGYEPQTAAPSEPLILPIPVCPSLRSGSQTTGHAWRCLTRDRPPEEWPLTPRWTTLLISRFSGLIPRIRPSRGARCVPWRCTLTTHPERHAKRLHCRRLGLPDRHARDTSHGVRLFRCHPGGETHRRALSA